MRRRLFNIASAVSLLLCVATVVLWIRSYSRIDAIRGWIGQNRVFFIDSEGGELTLHSIRYLDIQIPHPLPHSESEFKAGSFTRDSEGIMQEGRWRPWESFEPSDIFNTSFWRYHEGEVGSFGLVMLNSDPPNPPKYQAMRIMLQYWIACITLLALPAIFVLRKLSKLRSRSGCQSCGYNLTANASGVCPECGTPVSPKSEAVA